MKRLLVAVALLLAAAAALLATSEQARVRWWEWRMHSSDAAAAKEARRRLLLIGRPRIDAILPELFADEADACVSKYRDSFVFVARPSEGTVDALHGDLHMKIDEVFARKVLDWQPGDKRRILLAGGWRHEGPETLTIEVVQPLDPDMEREVIEAVKARLAKR